ncbi:MAG: GNAT family N-acyltransferase [Acidobacteriota bacterium]
MPTTTDRETDAPATYPVAADLVPDRVLDEGRYRLRFARTHDELDAILRLRFEVFNIELGEGLDESWETRRDRDPFDDVCHHLLVTDRKTGDVVGTYRMQVASMASEHLGWYSDAEFDLGGMPADLIEQSVEVGRACVALSHRNKQVLYLLWRGLASYMETNARRYLFGCCSLTSQDPAEGKAMLAHLDAKGYLHPTIRLDPRDGFECWDDIDAVPPFSGSVKIPKLFRTYLRHGALVLGPPAIDRAFKTIDFLIVLDIATFDARRRRTFFGSAPLLDLTSRGASGDPS